MLKLTTDKHEASRGLSATAELLVAAIIMKRSEQSGNGCEITPLSVRQKWSKIQKLAY